MLCKQKLLLLFTLNPELKIRPTQRTPNPVFENLTLKCLHQKYAFERRMGQHVQIRGAQEDTNNLQLLVEHFFK